MFQFPSFATPGLCIQPGVTSALPDVGFPIRRSTAQRLLTAPRRLSQFYHVLHRLLDPRHPPNALNSLTTGNVALSATRVASRGSGRWPSRHTHFIRRLATRVVQPARIPYMTLVDFSCDSSTINQLSDLELDCITAGELVRASHFVHLFDCQDQPISWQWAKKDLNFRPHAYQACALTN